MNTLRDGYTAVVLGAHGAIGAAFLESLEADPRCGTVVGLSRTATSSIAPDARRVVTGPPLDFDREGSIGECAEHLRRHAPLHLVVDATGALTIDGRGPEKRLDQIDPGALQRAFTINAIGPALLLRHLEPLLARGERVLWAKLSARVGSIEDNHKGGWYGYRASKAALNQLLQTAAIELARRRPECVVAAIQPGTVRSALSAPFVGADALDPRESAERLLGVLDGLPATGRAHFVDHRGERIPW